MKRKLLFLNLFILLISQVWSDIALDQQNIGSEKINQPAKRTPFSFETHFDAVAPAKIIDDFYEGEKVYYAEAEVEAGMIVYYCERFTEGVNLSVGFNATYLRWAQNPWFDQNHFNLLSLNVSGFTKRIEDWFWRTQFTANFNTDDWNGKYMSYDILLWGRYSYQENIGIHFGFWAEAGLRMDRIYPIGGFDWQISDKWLLSLVYPVNVSLVYTISKPWSIALAGRNFDSRFRVNRDEAFSKCLVRYTNVGAEFSVNYNTDTTNANIHAGVTLAGKYRVANQKNQHAHTYKLDSAYYAGVEMDVKF